MLSELNNATVPVAFGKVIVLSDPDASAAVSIISLASAVEPSNVIFPLASVMELAPSAAPEINVVDAKDVKQLKLPELRQIPHKEQQYLKVKLDTVQ